MKKGIVATALMVAFSCSAMAADMVPAETAAKIRAAFPKTKIEEVRLSEFPGLYELAMGRNVAYVMEGLPYLLVGHVFDTRTGTDLTAGRAEKAAPKVSFNDLPLQDAIKRGNGSKKLAVFSDPDCPFCKRLEGELAKLNDVTIYLFMNPIAGLHPKALEKSKAVWCAEDREKAWDSAIADKGFKTRDCDSSVVERNIALAQKLGIQGTPALIREDGELVPGMRPAKQLAQWLGTTYVEAAPVASAPAVKPAVIAKTK